jgi:hypothetical protein
MAMRNPLQFAEQKLMCGFAPSADSHIAALGVRLGFTFEASTTTACELASRLVERHMRVALAVPKHGQYMWTCAPSEPFLAEAAARVCHLETEAPTILSEHFASNVLARGERGETTARAYWTYAHDRVIRAMARPTEFDAPWYHRPIPVLSLLLQLFHPKLHNKILKARPSGDSEGPELQVAFKDTFVHFSHFAIAGNEEMLRVDDMYAALIRGMALQSVQDQRSIDAVIPIHMGKLDDEISPSMTSAINIQVNNRRHRRAVYIDRSITVPNNQVPVLSVVMELGDSGPRSCAGEECLVEFQSSSNCPSATLAKDPTRDHNHYVLVACGHGSKTYSVVSENSEKLYSQILASGTLLQDFPRSGEEKQVEALYNLKPCFEGGKDSHTGGWLS